LDITKPDDATKIRYANQLLICIDQAKEQLKSDNQTKEMLNDHLKALVVPCNCASEFRMNPEFIMNVFLNGIATGGIFATEGWLRGKAYAPAYYAYHQTLDNCSDSILNPCIDGTPYNGTVFNCPPCPIPPGDLACMHAAIKCCNRYISPICDPLAHAAASAAKQPYLDKARTVLIAGFTALITLQVLIQAFRLIYLRVSNRVTASTEAQITEYKTVLQTKIPNPAAANSSSTSTQAQSYTAEID
jgi:hypothetical protein